MDEIVKQAMAKWPNVPHCYGWLLLDARGAWRMRDERTQALQRPGDKIINPALIEFIGRNYTHDERGQWYFQNGPQRVYVDLEATPFVAHIDPANGLMLHTAERLSKIDSVLMTESGQLILLGMGKVALMDDRDLAACFEELQIENKAPTEEALFAWLDGSRTSESMTWKYQGRRYPVSRIPHEDLPERFNYIQRPRDKLSTD
ncbi:DUF2946 family protein [Oxalobacteraceae bacterium R-40]|uniref:DUF2946 family protein n=1 Tax=Keguizhuia sedimenti TaxID=3064264 RepID=A0ABU1BM94_9BURK|nr:DUF2946 family protein [Oxalobacteraceae bacterium R-40]